MIWNYIKTSIRNLFRQKVISLINIVGLSISLTVTLLLLKFIQHETSYDKFHENSDRVYRIVTHINLPDGKNLIAPMSFGKVPSALINESPEVACAIKLDKLDDKIKVGENKFYGLKNIIVDTSFFSIFTFAAYEGNPRECLKKPNVVVITQKASKRIFGSESSIGKTIELEQKIYTIGAVVKDVPSNSHLKFDIITSYLSLANEEQYINNRGISVSVYLMTKYPILDNSTGDKIKQIVNKTVNERLSSAGLTTTCDIQTLRDIHLHSKGFAYDIDGTGSITQIFIFSSIALLIFAIALINFINLIIARSETRYREISMRKISGASRFQLITQFVGESILLSVISMLIAIALAEVLLPSFCSLVEREIARTFLSVDMLVEILVLAIVTGVIAGLYPSFYISRLNPNKALKGESKGAQSLSLLQILLVLVQFSITIFLIICVTTLGIQIRYMKEKDLGFNKEVYVVSGITPKIEGGYQSIKKELESIPGVIGVSASESIPGQQSTLQNGYKEGDNPESSILIQENRVQNGYINTMRISLVEGRDFDPNLASDSSSFIVNQAAVKALGLTNPIGTWIHVWRKKGVIIGVTNDYHSQSLHSKISPLVLTRFSNNIFYILVNLEVNNVRESIKRIEKKLIEYDPTYDFTGKFVNDYFNGEYRREEKLGMLTLWSSALAIVIALMGLFALTYFTTNRKTKEIGIRKALGASSLSIGIQMIWKINKWVALSNIIAWPIAFFATGAYLQNFAYRVDPQFWVFVVAGLVAFLVAFLTILGHTLKVSSQNPVKALRYE